MGKDVAEGNNRADRLIESRAAAAAAAGVFRLPPRDRLKIAAEAQPDVRETNDARKWRGRCPVCKRRNSFVVRLDDADDIQRKCFARCSMADIQDAAPLTVAILKAHPLPVGWIDDGSELAEGLRRWLYKHGDADDAPPARRARVQRGLIAHGAASSRAGSPEYDAAARTLALDAGRDPSAFRGRKSITADILALPSKPIERLRLGRPVRKAGRWVLESSRFRLNIPPADDAARTAEPPHVMPGGNMARGAGGETWRTLDNWPDYGRASMPTAGLSLFSGLAEVTSKRHVRLFVDLGLAHEVDAPPTWPRGKGRPPKFYVLTAAASAAIEDADDAALAALARLAPARQNLRGKAAQRISRDAARFAADILEPFWPRRRAAATADALALGRLAQQSRSSAAALAAVAAAKDAATPDVDDAAAAQPAAASGAA